MNTPTSSSLRATIGRLRRFGSFSAADQRLLLICALCLPIFWISLRTFGLGRVQARLQSGMPSMPRSVAPNEALALGQLVNMAARHSWFPATCLTRSVLLQWLLRRRGIDSRLRIGVRTLTDALEAHAWVECQGMPVNDDTDVASRYAPVGQFTSPRQPG